MDWDTYRSSIIERARLKSYNDYEIKFIVDYCKKLFDSNLPIIFDCQSLSFFTRIKLDYLLRVMYSSSHFYRSFTIPKKTFGERSIDEPLPLLKECQRRILDKILCCSPVHPCAKAYRHNVSTKDNARFHRNQDIMIKIDIKDFFPSIKWTAIVNVFKELGYFPHVAIYLANLCSLQKKLPQGAPSSSAISNVVMYDFDTIIYAYCRASSLRYTRYSDDITISGNSNVKPGVVIRYVSSQLWQFGFQMNSKKTRVLRQSQRQMVTGLVTNKTINVEKGYRKKIRQELYYIQQFGLAGHMIKAEITSPNYLEKLRGRVSYCLSIRPGDEEMQLYKSIVDRLIRL